VEISGTPYTYNTRWSGEVLACPSGFLAFDTETDATLDPGRHVQPLALASASDSSTHTLVHPDDLPRFVLAHKSVRWVGHNSSFDFWVVEQHLRRRGEREALAGWWAIAEENRLHDSMLLDGLLRLARDDSFPRPRDLGVLAEQYAGLEIDKSDPYRLRYGEVIGKNWNTIEVGFFNYAIKDAIVTLPTYLAIREQALAVADAFARVDKDVLPDARERFGLLTEAVQVKKAIALAAIQHNGMSLDRRRLAAGEADLRRRLAGAVAEVRAVCPALYKVAKDGSLKLTRGGAPARSNKVLSDTLDRAAQELKGQGLEVSVPLTPRTRKPVASREVWQEYADHHPFLRPWLEVEGLAKELQFYNHLREDKVHPQYTAMVRSGRTSARAPNIQQTPRDGDLRTAFVASPGHFLLEIDYKFIELVTLAAVCALRYGWSALADVIQAGQDPHAHTAALMLGLTPGAFADWKKDPDRKDTYKDARQSAKAVNFGVPGGLGARSLAGYARSTYGVVLTEDEARQKREQLLDIYPELAEYLAEDGCTILARNLKADVSEVRARWDALFHLTCARKVLRDPNPTKEDGQPYKPGFVDRIWQSVAALNQDPDLADALANRRPGKQLADRVCLAGVSTLTGRVRGGVSYTQCRNTPFQGLAADGAALALFELVKAGFRVVGFVHDAFLIEMVDEGGYVPLARVRRAEQIVCDAMGRVLVGGIPVSVESKLARRWYKQAELIVEGNRVLPWEPNGGEPVPDRVVGGAVVDAPAAVGTRRIIPGTAGPYGLPPGQPSPRAHFNGVTEVPLATTQQPAVIPRRAPNQVLKADGPLWVTPRTVRPSGRGWRPVPGPLKWFGGKGARQGQLSRWIVRHFPPHLYYVEPFAGGLSVLLARDPEDPRLWLGTKTHERGVSEVVNDLHGPLTTFWRVLADPVLFADFARRVQATPLCEPRWVQAQEHSYGHGDPVTDAAEFFVCNRMSLGGRMDGFATLSKTRTRGNRNEQANAWLSAVEGLADVHARLRGVVVLNRDALEVIRQQDGPGTLFYLDPPYRHETRVCADGYAHEMTEAQHRELLSLIKQVRGKVLISGYASTLYDGALVGWNRNTHRAVADSGGGAEKGGRVEVLWANFEAGKSPATPHRAEVPDLFNDPQTSISGG
jgi:DNA adenine methylase